jgi:hypothetical protein
LRTAAQLLLILAGCFAACWALNLYSRSIPGLISGEVIDWKTGQPAPDIDVRAHELNSSKVVARTDAHGRFSFQPRDMPNVYFLFASSPGYGKLLQATFGQTIVMYRRSQRVRDVVIPAIPATELSGHVYGSDGKPISGCSVSALTRASHFDTSAELQVQAASTTRPSDLPEADDPNNLMEVESGETNADGRYVFRTLGADRYFVLTRCKETQTRGKSVPFAWVPTLYPDVNSIANAREIVLLPGDRRVDIDFHMQRTRAYTLDGKIIFSDHSVPKPWPEAVSSQDLVVFRTDRSLTSTWLGREPCQIDANAGRFRCDSLLPGEYTFYFKVSPGFNVLPGPGAFSYKPTQVAKVRYYVQATDKHSPTVQLHDVPDGGVRYQMPHKGPEGNLDLRRVCATAPDGRPAIQVLAWGQKRAQGGACYYMTFFGNTRLRLPSDSYNVNAFEAAFIARKYSYAGNTSKFEDVLMQRGTRIKLDAGQTIEPSLPVLTTTQLIDIALTSLRAAP